MKWWKGLNAALAVALGMLVIAASIGASVWIIDWVMGVTSTWNIGE